MRCDRPPERRSRGGPSPVRPKEMFMDQVTPIAAIGLHDLAVRGLHHETEREVEEELYKVFVVETGTPKSKPSHILGRCIRVQSRAGLVQRNWVCLEQGVDTWKTIGGSEGEVGQMLPDWWLL